MSGKVKMRCARCGKTFKSGNAKQVFCADCEQKERAARAAMKESAAKSPAATPVLVSKPKIIGAGAHILDPNAPPPAPETPPTVRAAQHSGALAPLAATVPAKSGAQATPTTHPAKPAPQVKPKVTGKRAADRKEAKPQKEQAKAVHLSEEQRAAVEARYLELAHPVEYDGIRSQIAGELGVPKSAVKRAVLDLRRRMQMPSWWELQAYTGTPEDLERIRTAYVPLLPVPEVGIHRRLAEQLGLDQTAVYQGIRRIRAEMRLPQYNPPETHETLATTSGATTAGAASAPALAESAAETH